MRLIDAVHFREKLLEFRSKADDKWGKDGTVQITCMVDLIVKRIDDTATIDPESLRPRAHWIRKRSKFPGGELTVVECSLCECQQWNETNFCPICGAKMEDREE